MKKPWATPKIIKTGKLIVFAEVDGWKYYILRAIKNGRDNQVIIQGQEVRPKHI